MDAIRVARAATGRDSIIKMEGSYHGHHDSVLFSVVPEADVLGLRHDVDETGKAWYTTEPTSKGVPKALWDTVIVAVQRRRGGRGGVPDNPGEIAAVILEPVMMNIGIVVPKPGYLQALRDACEKHGAVLIFDEVKCGGTIAYGGTTERYGVRPHLAAYAKADRRRRHDRRVRRRGPIHGVGHEGRGPAGHVQRQPAVVGGRPRGAHRGAHERRVRPPRQARHAAGRGLQPRDRRHGIPGHTVDLGAKGCVSYRSEPLTNYRDFLETDAELFYASYPWMVNRGHLHDPRRRGAVDDLGAAHRGRRPERTSTRSASSARSSRATHDRTR